MSFITKRRKHYSLREKYKILKELETCKQTDIVKKYGIAGGTISGFIKDRERILYLYEKSFTDRKRHPKRHCQEIDDALYLWYKNKAKSNARITSSSLKQKAQEIAEILGVDFVTSNWWVDSFRRRINLEKKFDDVSESEEDEDYASEKRVVVISDDEFQDSDDDNDDDEEEKINRPTKNLEPIAFVNVNDIEEIKDDDDDCMIIEINEESKCVNMKMKERNTIPQSELKSNNVLQEVSKNCEYKGKVDKEYECKHSERKETNEYLLQEKEYEYNQPERKENNEYRLQENITDNHVTIEVKKENEYNQPERKENNEYRLQENITDNHVTIEVKKENECQQPERKDDKYVELKRNNDKQREMYDNGCKDSGDKDHAQCKQPRKNDIHKQPEKKDDNESNPVKGEYNNEFEKWLKQNTASNQVKRKYDDECKQSGREDHSKSKKLRRKCDNQYEESKKIKCQIYERRERNRDEKPKELDRKEINECIKLGTNVKNVPAQVKVEENSNKNSDLYKSNKCKKLDGDKPMKMKTEKIIKEYSWFPEKDYDSDDDVLLGFEVHSSMAISFNESDNDESSKNNFEGFDINGEFSKAFIVKRCTYFEECAVKEDLNMEVEEVDEDEEAEEKSDSSIVLNRQIKSDDEKENDLRVSCVLNELEKTAVDYAKLFNNVLTEKRLPQVRLTRIDEDKTLIKHLVSATQNGCLQICNLDKHESTLLPNNIQKTDEVTPFLQNIAAGNSSVHYNQIQDISDIKRNSDFGLLSENGCINISENITVTHESPHFLQDIKTGEYNQLFEHIAPAKTFPESSDNIIVMGVDEYSQLSLPGGEYAQSKYPNILPNISAQKSSTIVPASAGDNPEYILGMLDEVDVNEGVSHNSSPVPNNSTYVRSDVLKVDEPQCKADDVTYSIRSTLRNVDLFSKNIPKNNTVQSLKVTSGKAFTQQNNRNSELAGSRENELRKSDTETFISPFINLKRELEKSARNKAVTSEVHGVSGNVKTSSKPSVVFNSKVFSILKSTLQETSTKFPHPVLKACNKSSNSEKKETVSNAWDRKTLNKLPYKELLKINKNLGKLNTEFVRNVKNKSLTVTLTDKQPDSNKSDVNTTQISIPNSKSSTSASWGNFFENTDKCLDDMNATNFLHNDSNPPARSDDDNSKSSILNTLLNKSGIHPIHKFFNDSASEESNCAIQYRDNSGDVDGICQPQIVSVTSLRCLDESVTVSTIDPWVGVQNEGNFSNQSEVVSSSITAPDNTLPQIVSVFSQQQSYREASDERERACSDSGESSFPSYAILDTKLQNNESSYNNFASFVNSSKSVTQYEVKKSATVYDSIIENNFNQASTSGIPLTGVNKPVRQYVSNKKASVLNPMISMHDFNSTSALSTHTANVNKYLKQYEVSKTVDHSQISNSESVSIVLNNRNNSNSLDSSTLFLNAIKPLIQNQVNKSAGTFGSKVINKGDGTSATVINTNKSQIQLKLTNNSPVVNFKILHSGNNSSGTSFFTSSLTNGNKVQSEVNESGKQLNCVNYLTSKNRSSRNLQIPSTSNPTQFKMLLPSSSVKELISNAIKTQSNMVKCSSSSGNIKFLPMSSITSSSKTVLCNTVSTSKSSGNLKFIPVSSVLPSGNNTVLRSSVPASENVKLFSPSSVGSKDNTVSCSSSTSKYYIVSRKEDKREVTGCSRTDGIRRVKTTDMQTSDVPAVRRTSNVQTFIRNSDSIFVVSPYSSDTKQ